MALLFLLSVVCCLVVVIVVIVVVVVVIVVGFKLVHYLYRIQLPRFIEGTYLSSASALGLALSLASAHLALLLASALGSWLYRFTTMTLFRSFVGD